MHTEINHTDRAGAIMMKAVPIIGVAVQDGSVERKYIEKLEELARTNPPQPLSPEELAQIPSKLMR